MLTVPAPAGSPLQDTRTVTSECFDSREVLEPHLTKRKVVIALEADVYPFV